MIINKGLAGEISFEGAEEDEVITVKSKAYDPLIKREDALKLAKWLCEDFLRLNEVEEFRKWFEKEFFYIYDNE